ncbi:hypothetical protein PIB30_115467, partial [Stylosanthes scabra]|nr:hypothetical protein [Stylosanthes scabra]
MKMLVLFHHKRLRQVLLVRARSSTRLTCRILTWKLYLVLVGEIAGLAAVHRFLKGRILPQSFMLDNPFIARRRLLSR